LDEEFQDSKILKKMEPQFEKVKTHGFAYIMF
jgi:hypothetical protein